jgi:cytochrome c peroxidase
VKFIDRGVGDFLSGPNNINSEWKPYANSFYGKFQTSTLRNVDKRPSPDFVKAYMHNGYLKSLKEVVHFYNTRDTLGPCKGPNVPDQKVSCWPAPEVPQNLNTTIGHLNLTDKEEDQIVAFMKTLTDGYQPSH